MTDIEMLNAENARLTKLVIELRAEVVRLNAQAVPDAQEKDLLQAIQERDAADDYIDALLDEVLGTDRPEWSSAYGHADAMEQVRETMGSLMKPYVDKAWDRFQSALAAPAAPQPAQADAEPLQVFVSPRAKALMQAFEDGWRSCADSEYIGKEAQNDAFNQSRTVDHCIAEDTLFTQPAQPLDLGVMELAESVGLIGPASRTDDLHEAIRRFHYLIVENASSKAALHFADGLAKSAQQDDDEGDALTVAYLYGHGKGKDSAQPVLSEKDALLRQALEALEAYSKSGYVRHEHPKKYAAGNAVAEAIRNHLGVET